MTSINPVETSYGPGEAAVQTVELTMPMPPSVNHAFRNIRRGRALTPKAKAWKDEAHWKLRGQKPPLLVGPVIIVFGFERAKAMRRADADNRVKLALDALVRAEVIVDDRHVAGCAFSWIPPANGLCHVVVTTARPVAANFHTSPDGAVGSWVLDAPPQHLETAHGH